MIVIGLTGGIGMGKSTVAAQLAALGAKICNADAIVHKLLAKGGAAVEEVGKSFPGAVKNGAVDRGGLSELVFKDKGKLKLLERILHPLVVAEENRFIGKERRLGAKIVVLDIPLLFETQGEERCDMVIVAGAPPFIQKQRVMKRPNMTEQKFKAIVRSQMPEYEKRNRADRVIQTGLGKGHSFKNVALLVRGIYAAT